MILIVFVYFFFFFYSDVGDSPSDQVQEDMDSEVYPSEDGTFLINILDCF